VVALIFSKFVTAKHCIAIMDMAGDMASKRFGYLDVWIPNYTLDDI
jgi:hypothetical protein